MHGPPGQEPGAAGAITSHNGTLPSGAVAGGAQSPTLTISNFRQQDAGQYYCLINGCNPLPSAVARLTWCPADFNCDGQITPADVGVFISTWLYDLQNATPPPAPGDFDGNGIVNSADVAAFINAWFAAVTNEC